MKKKWCCAALLVAAFHTVCAQDNRPEYAAGLIPDSMKKNAHAVVRVCERTFRMDALDRCHDVTHCVVTVLEPRGDHYGVIEAGYTPGLNEVDNIKATLYDSAGVRIRKMKSSDVEDHNLDIDGALVDDSRFKYYNFVYRTYPYTVEYEVDIKLLHSYSFPEWQPQANEDVAVEQSKFTVLLPDNYPLRYHLTRVDKPKESSPGKGMHAYDWEVHNRPAVPHEVLSEAWSRRSPNVLTGPGDFEMQRYKGNMSSWNNMARFFATLNAGRDVLPDAVLAKVHQLTDTLKTTDAKIAALYRYMQANTRYVNISFGIGGLQTYDAQYVAKRGYGDCKALSNYMQSLLKAAGIPASCVLIHAGDYETDFVNDFVSDQFSHVIVMVPQDKDTTWLECTSQTLYPGYLSAFTANRYALAINNDGGALVHTPNYDVEKNVRLINLQVAIAANGNAHMVCTSRHSCLEQDEQHYIIHNHSREEIIKLLKDFFPLPSFDVTDYTWQEYPGKLPVISAQTTLEVTNYAQATGRRLFLRPNVLSLSGIRLNKDTVRQSNLQINVAFHQIDTIAITIPAGFKAESMQKPVDLHTAFGDYHSEVSLKDNTVIYLREYRQNGGVFPAAMYQAAARFFDEVYRTDRMQAVFVKNDQ